MNEIYLKDIWAIDNPNEYKAHFAKINEHGLDPLVEWCKDSENLDGWQAWKGENQDFNRKFIFAMIRLPEDKQTYLFVGVFEVIKQSDQKQGHHTEVELTKQGEQFIGRLILQRKKSVRNVRLNFENRYNGEPDNMLVVKEILRSQYTCD